VPDVLPFPGIRYDCGAAGAELGMLAAPPYDVVDEELHATLEANDERNSVRLILPRDPVDPADGGDRYQLAATTFETWLHEGVLFRDGAPRFYGYRMRYRDAHGRARHTHGVIGALTLPERDATDVLPHERTLPKAKSDRLSLLSAMRVNVDPIWCLTLRAGLTDLLEPAAPLCSCRDEDGVEHELFAIDDAAQIDAITQAIGEAPLVLADGHHRFETACNYRDRLRAEGVEVGGANAIMSLVVELSEDELCIDAIHRLVTVPDGVDVRATLADAFTIDALGPNTSDVVERLVARMPEAGALGLVDRHGAALATPRDEIVAPLLATEPEVVRHTSAAVVEQVVVPRLADATWVYRHDAFAVAAQVDKGAASAALLCVPVSVSQTRAAAVAGIRMPQKTTFFSPKPRTGMVFRSLD
jgi:uncharacterized protein (DUF1015 family)